MKKEFGKKKLSLNKKTIQLLTGTAMHRLNGGGTSNCPPPSDNSSICQSDPNNTCVGLTPQTMCVGGTTVTISGCNTGGGGTGRC